MKKYILSIAVIATAAIAGWNYQQNKESVVMSDLALENIEALARNEGSDRKYQTMGYCTPSRMDYMCTSRHTAESCRRHCS